MNTQSTFDPNALTKLAERVEYETWLLEAVYALVEQELFPSWPDGVVYPVDSSEAQFIAHIRGNQVVGDWRPGFQNAGAPLIFVIIFKVLDMLIEWILEENKVSPGFRFQQKLANLNKSVIFPPVIESRPWLKELLIGLYSTLEPLRGTIIHNKHFTSTNGAIRVSSTKKDVVGSPVEISAAHLRQLAYTIVSVLRYVDGTWDLDEFRERVLQYNFDELVALHGLSTLGQKLPFHTRVRMYLKGSDPLRFDPTSIRSDIDARYVANDCSFDVRIMMVRDSKVVDSYLFPWSLFAVPNADWSHTINVKQYKTAIVDDHLYYGPG